MCKIINEQVRNANLVIATNKLLVPLGADAVILWAVHFTVQIFYLSNTRIDLVG